MPRSSTARETDIATLASFGCKYLAMRRPELYNRNSSSRGGGDDVVCDQRGMCRSGHGKQIEGGGEDAADHGGPRSKIGCGIIATSGGRLPTYPLPVYLVGRRCGLSKDNVV